MNRFDQFVDVRFASFDANGFEQRHGHVFKRRIARLHRREAPEIAFFDKKTGLELGDQAGAHQR